MSQPHKSDGYIPDIPPPPYSREDPAADEVASAPPSEDLKIPDPNSRIPDSESSFFYPRSPYEVQSTYGSSSAPQPSYQNQNQNQNQVQVQVPPPHQPFYNTFGAPSSPPRSPHSPPAAATRPAGVSIPSTTSPSAAAESTLGSGDVECSPESPVPPENNDYDELPVRIPATASVYINVEGNGFGSGSIALMPTTERGANETRILISGYSNGNSSSDRLPQFDYIYDQASGSLRINVKKFKGWGCSARKVVIMVPPESSSMTVSTKNMAITVEQQLAMAGQLYLKTKNAKIIFKGGWRGERLNAETDNSEIIVEGKVEAVSSVRLKASNSAIKILDICSVSNGPMEATTSNGQIIVGKILARSDVSLVTSNAKVIVDSVRAISIVLKTSNAIIQVGHSWSDGNIDMITSNGKISALIASAAIGKVEAKTSNAGIDLNMSRYYRGRFDVSTSSSQATVTDNFSPQSIFFEVNRKERKMGYKSTPTSPGSIIMSTSHSNAVLTFDMVDDMHQPDGWWSDPQMTDPYYNSTYKHKN